MNKKRYIIRITALSMFLFFTRNTAYFCSLITEIKTFAETATNFFVGHHTRYSHKALPLRYAPIDFPSVKKDDYIFPKEPFINKNLNSPTPLSIARGGKTKKIIL